MSRYRIIIDGHRVKEFATLAKLSKHQESMAKLDYSQKVGVSMGAIKIVPINTESDTNQKIVDGVVA